MTLVSGIALGALHFALLAAGIPQRLDDIELPADCAPVLLPAPYGNSVDLTAKIAGLSIFSKVQRLCRTNEGMDQIVALLARTLRPREEPLDRGRIRAIEDARAEGPHRRASVVHYNSPEVNFFPGSRKLRMAISLRSGSTPAVSTTLA